MVTKIGRQADFYQSNLAIFRNIKCSRGFGAPALFLSAEEIENQLDAATSASASAGGWSVSISPGVSVRRRSSAVKQFAIFHP